MVPTTSSSASTPPGHEVMNVDLIQSLSIGVNGIAIIILSVAVIRAKSK